MGRGAVTPLHQSLLMSFDREDDDVATFVDTLPPFGVLQIASVTWEALGHPDEILVSVAPTSGAVTVSLVDRKARRVDNQGTIRG